MISKSEKLKQKPYKQPSPKSKTKSKPAADPGEIDSREAWEVRSHIELLLKPLPHHMQVQFAYDCAKSVANLDESGSSERSLAAVARWLTGETVTIQELHDAAANAAAHAAHAAAHAANAAAAHAAAHAANAAAAHAASAYAAAAAAAAASAASGLVRFEQELVSRINNLHPLEKMVYGVVV